MAKNTLIPLPLARKLVAQSLPPRATGTIHLRNLGGYTVIELITNAWKRLPLMEKILRVHRALDSGLTEAQKNSILRVAVLTPKEERDFLEAHPRVAKSRQRRSRGGSEVTGTVPNGGASTLKSARRRTAP